MQTSKNKKFISDIARIDNDIEDLMKQVWLSVQNHPIGAVGG